MNDISDLDNDLANMKSEVVSIHSKNALTSIGYWPENSLGNGREELGIASGNLDRGGVNQDTSVVNESPMVLVDFSVENACSPPRLEQTLLLTNSSTTPIDLIHNISSGKPTDAEKSEIDDLSFLRETLQNAGYTPLEVEKSNFGLY